MLLLYPCRPLVYSGDDKQVHFVIISGSANDIFLVSGHLSLLYFYLQIHGLPDSPLWVYDFLFVGVGFVILCLCPGCLVLCYFCSSFLYPGSCLLSPAGLSTWAPPTPPPLLQTLLQSLPIQAESSWRCWWSPVSCAVLGNMWPRVGCSGLGCSLICMMSDVGVRKESFINLLEFVCNHLIYTKQNPVVILCR